MALHLSRRRRTTTLIIRIVQSRRPIIKLFILGRYCINLISYVAELLRSYFQRPSERDEEFPNYLFKIIVKRPQQLSVFWASRKKREDPSRRQKIIVPFNLKVEDLNF